MDLDLILRTVFFVFVSTSFVQSGNTRRSVFHEENDVQSDTQLLLTTTASRTLCGLRFAQIFGSMFSK